MIPGYTRVIDVQSALGAYQLEAMGGDDYLGVQIAQAGRPYEERLLRLVVGLTRPGDHILDVGANIGNHTVYWAKAGRSVTAFNRTRPS
jgi:hypothetical protein